MTAVNSQPLNNPWRTPQNDRIQPISLSAQDLAANIKRDIATSIRTMPIVTFLFASTIIGLFILDLFINLLLKFSILKSNEIWADLMYKSFLLSPVKIVKSYQGEGIPFQILIILVWRLATYVYPESGVFRLIVHLLVTVSLSSQFEKRTGSVKYFYLLNAFFILVPAAIYSSLASFALSGPKALPAIADEGNIFFSLLVCQVREAPQSNPCETCNISSNLYPIALFLIISLFSSRAAITMQFFGLLMGYLCRVCLEATLTSQMHTR
ncbi:Rhomboid domain-containing protein 2, variant 2 [Entomophthora muscae]|uniref:Rhomboid domain-containing protein 2, variant 2 n=1 Tax=Entomophthora muscae TaxID=34485 RepID=A0ACC2S4Y7_9FUNG|nr:Rhomboid domain-containing protein 2, variant 2 [Entomophthora muscae]